MFRPIIKSLDLPERGKTSKAHEADYWGPASKPGAIPMDADDYAEEKARADRRARVSICAEAVQCAVNAVLGEDDRKKPIGRSLYSYLLWEMTKAASDYASAENIDRLNLRTVS